MPVSTKSEIETELEEYLHLHIPLTAKMSVEVESVTTHEVVLLARLQPNLNHERTAFGGSISALAMLAGWAVLRQRFRQSDPVPTLVVQKSETRFDRPITDDFRAYVTNLDEERWEDFESFLKRYGKARIELDSVVESRGLVCARQSGRFVALYS